MSIAEQIKVYFTALALLSVVVVPSAQAQQTLNAGGGVDLQNAGYIFNTADLKPSETGGMFGFTNTPVTAYVINIGQLVGHYADGSLITDYRDMLPFVGQSMQVVDQEGNTVVSINDMGLNMYDPVSSNFVPVTVSNGMIVVGGTTLGTVVDTDDQSLSLSGTQLDIEDGAGVDLGAVFVTGTDLTTLSNTFSTAITEVSDRVTSTSNTLSTAITEVSDSVTSTSNNLASSITTVSNTLSSAISAGAGTDDQTLTLNGGDLSIEDGNTVDWGSAISSITNTALQLLDPETGETASLTVSNGMFYVNGEAIAQTTIITNSVDEAADPDFANLQSIDLIDTSAMYVPQVADFTKIYDTSYGILYSQTTAEGLPGVGFRVTGLSSTTRYPMAEFQTLILEPGKRMKLLFYIGNVTLSSASDGSYYFGTKSDASVVNAQAYNDFGSFYLRYSSVAPSDFAINTSPTHADVYNADNIWSLDHGDYIQITIEWTASKYFSYKYIHKVDVSPDGQTFTLAEQLHYSGMTSSLFGNTTSVSPIFRFASKTGNKFTGTNGPLLVGVEVEDM